MPGTAGNSFTCAIPNNQAPETFTGLDATGLFFGIKCAPVLGDPNCAAGSTEHYAQAEMYSVSVTLAEAGMPTISHEGGPLWAGGVVSGTMTLTFTATDPSGIGTWSLSDDQGSTLYAFPESCDYTQVTPCAQLSPEQLNVDTTHIPDGNHTVTITATNAAGNHSTATSPPLVIDNNGPGTPVSLSASPAGGNTINVAWGNPASPPQPITGAVAELCAATCTPTTLPDTGHAQLTAPGPGNYTVRLWLTDTAGKGGTNVATTPVTVPAITTTTTTTSTTSTQSHGKPAAPKLTISHRVRHSRLTLTVHVPATVHGTVTISYDAYRGRKRVAFARRRIKPRHGIAQTSFTLSKSALTASRLTVHAAASGAIAVTANLPRRGARLHRPGFMDHLQDSWGRFSRRVSHRPAEDASSGATLTHREPGERPTKRWIEPGRGNRATDATDATGLRRTA